MQGEANKDKRALGYGAHLHLHIYLSNNLTEDFLSEIILEDGVQQVVVASKTKNMSIHSIMNLNMEV